MPRLKTRCELESQHIHVKSLGHDSEFEFVERSVGADLVATLVLDRPRSIRSVPPDDLQKMEVTEEQAWQLAAANFWRADADKFRQHAEGVWVSDDDNYAASRILLGDAIKGLEMKGQPVCFVPNRDLAVIADSANHSALELDIELAASGHDHQRKLSPRPYLHRDGEFEWLRCADSGPVSIAVDNLHVLGELWDYEDQKHALDRLNEKTGHDVYVGSLMVHQDKATGKYASAAVWTDQIISWIPAAETIHFSDAQNHVGSADFKEVLKVFGDRLEPTSHFPVRYEAGDLPPIKQLKALASFVASE